jgi:hypothetical protein
MTANNAGNIRFVLIDQDHTAGKFRQARFVYVLCWWAEAANQNAEVSTLTVQHVTVQPVPAAAIAKNAIQLLRDKHIFA